VDRAILPVAVGLLGGVGVATFASVGLAVLSGTLTPILSSVGVALGVTVGVLAGRAVARVDAGAAAGKAGWADFGAMAIFGVVAGRQFLGLHVERAGQVLTWDVFNYGDLPLHITYIRYFAGGAPFWPENPVFPATRLLYPIGIDVWNAMLLQLGIPLGLGLVATGLVASALLGLALWRWGAAFALLAFLLSGGAGDAGDLVWKNLFLALFVTQRGFLFALPAGLLLLESWRRRFLTDAGAPLPAWVEATLWGLLPVFHLHSFLLLSLLFGLWALATRRLPRAWLTLGIAFVPASVGVLLVTDGFRAASLLGWEPGWILGKGESVLLSLARNFTIYPFFVALGAWAAWQRRERAALLCLGPALAVLWVLFFAKLQPWAWDNTKLMLWCYLLTLPAIALGLERLPGLARGALVSLWLLPGTVNVADATLDGRHGYAIYDVAEVDAVCDALRPVAVEERIAAFPTFNHPVALCGHALVAGYGGHLWSHGIDPRRVSERLEVLMNGGPGWEQAARDVHARYLFWGAREASQWRGSRRPWEANAAVASGSWGRLYDLAAK